MNESISIASISASSTVLSFVFFISHPKVGLFNPSTKLVKTIWSIKSGLVRKARCPKVREPQRKLAISCLGSAACQLPDALSKYQHLWCNSAEMRPSAAQGRLVAPGTRWSRNATYYLSTKVRSVLVDDHVSLRTSRPAWLLFRTFGGNIRSRRNL